MTENDANSVPKENPENADDDLENLSLDEKAAFEKIMAEISSMNPNDSDSTQEVETDSVGSESAAADTTETQSEKDPPKIPDDQTTPEDQQAALDKIMAEISADGDAEASQPENTPEPAEDDDSLSDDQQAALDKIMAEISARNEGEEPQPENATEDAKEDDDSLSDDQQAALDKIMAEISARNEGEEPQPENATEDAEEDDDSLSDDQQAAEPGVSAEPDNAEDTHASVETPLDPKSETQKLSLDEFNDELDNLLSIEELNGAEPSPENPQSVESDPEVEDKRQNDEAPPDETPTAETPLTETAPQPDKIDQLSETPARKEQPQHPAGALLVEVDTDQDEKPLSRKKSVRRNPKTKRSLKLVKISMAAVASIIILGSGYWSYITFIRSKPGLAGQVEPVSNQTAPSTTDSGTISDASGPVETGVQSSASAPIPEHRQSSSTSFGSLRKDLIATRSLVNQKIDEIVNLKAYYKKGIQEEETKIRSELSSKSIPSLEKAMANNQIELSLQAIQRRMLYIQELDRPLDRLEKSSEELLYLERRTQLFETLSQWINTPSIPEYKLEISNQIKDHLQIAADLKLDQTQQEAPSMDSVWKNVLAEIQKENKASDPRPVNNVRDRQISREICGGDYSRKYLLTSLTAETAQCLIKWSGKDLYLNELAQLPPDLAKILIQWPGEWLSLNGIKEISVETARYLSQWPGKRLSLNGLKDLSPAVTAQLSKWQGEQLEMIGLASIGRWDNYATRLFLSEKLRRKLHM